MTLDMLVNLYKLIFSPSKVNKQYHKPHTVGMKCIK